MLAAYRDAIARDIFSHMAQSDPESIPRATIEGMASTNISRRFTTKKRRFKPKKTHLNIMTADSDLELSIGRELDRDRRVISWAKSDMANFTIPYVHPDSTERSYKPDFIAHLDTGVMLVLEGKGKEDDIDKAKKDALRRWVEAINREERYGVWDSATIHGGKNVRTSLDDIIRSTTSTKHRHHCQTCGNATRMLADTVRQFGLKKMHGLLRISYYCKKCRPEKRARHTS